MDGAASFATLSVVVTDSANGGKNLAWPDGDKFGRAEVVKVDPGEFRTQSSADDLASNGFFGGYESYGLLLEKGDGSEKFLLLFGNGAVATVCQQLIVYPFDGGAPEIVAFKPVVYLYPTEKTAATVSIDLDGGRFVAQYPKMVDGRWSVVAQPNGTLMDPTTDRRYPYLFWEAKLARPFRLERSKCFCVAKDDAASFLEAVSDRFALNEQERTDFITYWLPTIEANSYTVIQFMDDQYESQAKLSVTPRPDSVIRLYIVVAASPMEIDTGLKSAADLPQRERRGFTVVEWGGSNLDLHR